MTRTPADCQVYLEELWNATFCLNIRGYASWSPRLVDSLLLGCIPVIIGDSTHYPFQVLPISIQGRCVH